MTHSGILSWSAENNGCQSQNARFGWQPGLNEKWRKRVRSYTDSDSHSRRNCSVFVHRYAYFTSVQQIRTGEVKNALSQDWGVVGCSNLFWLTLWTLPALFGARTPPKSMCTHRHTRLKIFDQKMNFFCPNGVSAPGGVSNVKIVKSLSIKVQLPQKSIYSTPIHLKLILRSKQWR